MAREVEQPMTSERLAAIGRKQSKAWLNGDPWQADYRFDVADLLAEVERQRDLVDTLARQVRFEREQRERRERPLLVLLRAVATGEPLPEAFMWQARGWLQAEEEQEGGGDGA